MSDIYRNSIFWVEVERIKPNPYQPRREFDEAKLNELAESIRMYGLLQPLTVTRNELPRDDGGLMVEYELIAGERRLRASKIAGLLQVPVIIRSGEETDQMKLELAIIENLQREDLNPIDRALAFDKLFKEFKFNHTEIGKKVGRSREYVANTLRLLSLPEYIQRHLQNGQITEGHTRPLMMLNSRPTEQQVLLKEVLLKKLTVREAEQLARRVAQDRVQARNRIDPEILALERALTERLGTRVQIEPKETGGRVVISFFSASDLQGLLNSINLEESRLAQSEAFNGAPNAPAHPDFLLAPSLDDIATPTYATPNVTPQQVPEPQPESTVPAASQGFFERVLQGMQHEPASVNGEDRADDRIAQEEQLPNGASWTTHSEQGGVVPASNRPLPEEKPQNTAPAYEALPYQRFGPVAPAALQTSPAPAQHVEVRPVSPGTPQTTTQEQKQPEDDTQDLYAIRNFSI